MHEHEQEDERENEDVTAMLAPMVRDRWARSLCASVLSLWAERVAAAAGAEIKRGSSGGGMLSRPHLHPHPSYPFSCPPQNFPPY